MNAHACSRHLTDLMVVMKWSRSADGVDGLEDRGRKVVGLTNAYHQLRTYGEREKEEDRHDMLALALGELTQP